MKTLPAHSALLEMAEHVRSLAEHDAVPSPCFSVCKMDDQGDFCMGCMRTTQEIAHWGKADKAYQRQVWLLIEERARAGAT